MEAGFFLIPTLQGTKAHIVVKINNLDGGEFFHRGGFLPKGYDKQTGFPATG
jgi:hypothetical protein